VPLNGSGSWASLDGKGRAQESEAKALSKTPGRCILATSAVEAHDPRDAWVLRPPSRGSRSEPLASVVKGRVHTDFCSCRTNPTSFGDRGDLAIGHGDAPRLPEIFLRSKAHIDEARWHQIAKPLEELVAISRSGQNELCRRLVLQRVWEDPEETVVMLDGRHLYLQEASILLEVQGFGLGLGKRRLRRHEMGQLACHRLGDVGSNDGQIPVSAASEREPPAPGLIGSALVDHPTLRVERKGRMPMDVEDL
jgi:hypothetical protein